MRIYQVIEEYRSDMNGYSSPEKRIMKAFINYERAKLYRDNLEKERQSKEDILKEAGISNYQNKFTHYHYIIQYLEVDNNTSNSDY